MCYNNRVIKNKWGVSLKDKIRAIIILISFCVISLLAIGYDLYTTLHKQQEINENILYNSSEMSGDESSEFDESEYTVDVEFESAEYVEKQHKQSSSFETIILDEIPSRTHIGRCRLTIYTPYETSHGYNTATGVTAQHLMTCAVDPNIIPYGSNVILIKPDGTEHRLKAIDCGNFRGNMIDVFFDGKVSNGVGWLVETFGEEYADVWIERP